MGNLGHKHRNKQIFSHCSAMGKEFRGDLMLSIFFFPFFFFGRVGHEVLMFFCMEWGAGRRWSFRSQTILWFHEEEQGIFRSFLTPPLTKAQAAAPWAQKTSKNSHLTLKMLIHKIWADWGKPASFPGVSCVFLSALSRVCSLLLSSLGEAALLCWASIFRLFFHLPSLRLRVASSA